MLVKIFIILSPFQIEILAFGLLYLAVTLFFYDKYFKRGIYDLKKYVIVLANAFLASLVSFLGGIFLTSDLDMVEHSGIVLPICLVLPSALILFILIANIYLRKGQERQ